VSRESDKIKLIQ